MDLPELVRFSLKCADFCSVIREQPRSVCVTVTKNVCLLCNKAPVLGAAILSVAVPGDHVQV